jgi:hypothetical protein
MSSKLIGTRIKCRCGCGELFIKKSVQHVYHDGQKCRQRDVRRLIDLGEIVPDHYNDCLVCGGPVPVYKEVPSSARLLTCSTECAALRRAAKKNGTLSASLKPHRQTYCRQNGECDKYDICLDLGAHKEWPRDRGEECFKRKNRPLASYDNRSAIQMTPCIVSIKQGD